MRTDVRPRPRRCGDYVRWGVADRPFFSCPKPRWESLNDLMALLPLARATANASLAQAALNLWWSVVE